MCTTSSPSPRKLRILMLHGFTQSGPLFHAKTRALEKNLQKSFPTTGPLSLPSYPGGVELIYPTAPLRLHPSEIPGYDVDGATASSPSDTQVDAWGWWKRKGDSDPFVYEKLDEGLENIAGVLASQGPFDGAIGFSQGGALAGMLASLLEPGRREAFEAVTQKIGNAIEYPRAFESLKHPPLRFAVSYSGFGANNPLYGAFYDPKIQTPMMHFLGSVDTVVEEKRSLRLADACAVDRNSEEGRKRVVYHPGGHFLPSSQKQYVAALVAFIRQLVGEAAKDEPKKEENVEDMDMPF